MATSSAEVAEFPSPFSIATPPGCEGWEEMYPYWALFDEHRRDHDESRLWFWNSQHFPLPMPPFDMVEVDHPYYTLGGWQNRAFATPPAMGIDYRVVNGYVYISPNPVTDPDKIAERAGFFEKRAGHYFENWDELYAGWRTKMEALIREVEQMPVPELPEYEPDAVVFGDQNLSNIDLLAGLVAHAPLRRADVAAPLRVPAARLRRLPDVLGVLQGALPDIPDQHISQMIAGIDVLLFRADAELRRLARLAIETGVDGAFVEGRTPAEIDAELAGTDAGRALARRARGDQGPVVQHGHRRRPVPLLRQLARRPEHPVRVADRARRRRSTRGRDVERPTEELERERDRLAEEYGALLDEEARGAVPGAARAVAHGLPVRRGAQVLLRLLVPVALLQQGPRVRRAARARTASSRTARTSSSCRATRPPRRSRSCALTWSTGGPPLGPQPLAADRRPPPRAARAAWPSGPRRPRSARCRRRSTTRSS